MPVTEEGGACDHLVQGLEQGHDNPPPPVDENNALLFGGCKAAAAEECAVERQNTPVEKQFSSF